MSTSGAPIRIPDLSARPFNLVAEHACGLLPATLYEAWSVDSTNGLPHPARCSCAPKSTPYLWVTGALGTEGSETVVTVKLSAANGGTHLHLIHAGFPNAAARDRHAQAGPRY